MAEYEFPEYHTYPPDDLFPHGEEVTCMCKPDIEAKYAPCLGPGVLVQHRMLWRQSEQSET